MLIKSFEGFRPRAVHRRDGSLTIGYGHTDSAREGIEITEKDAELLLMHDLIPVVRLLNTLSPSGLTQNQFDALTSLAFSIGLERFGRTEIPNLLRKGRVDEVAEVLANIPDRRQPPIDLPYRRRCAERSLFEADGPLGIESLLLAPIQRPGPYIAPPEDAPLGTTGVLRHEGLNMAPSWSTPCRQTLKAGKDLGTIILLGAVGVVIVITIYIAVTHGSAIPFVRENSLLVTAVLTALLSATITGVIHLLTHKPERARKKQAR